MDNGGTALIYAWNDSEDYWQGVLPEGSDDPAGPFSHAKQLLGHQCRQRAAKEMLFHLVGRAILVAHVDQAAEFALQGIPDLPHFTRHMRCQSAHPTPTAGGYCER